MREILFRGKRIDNNEWVEGYYVKITSTAEVFHQSYKVIVHSIFSSEENFVKVEVIPETVGQYTGLTDKNGKKIFEGDIVWDEINEQLGVVGFDEGEFVVNFGGVIDANGFVDVVDTCYVQGNIHDNPELVKGGDLYDWF